MLIKFAAITGMILVAIGAWLILQQPAVHTVSWYMAHPTERAERLAAGADNPSRNRDDYTNAWTAEMKADANSYLAASRSQWTH